MIKKNYKSDLILKLTLPTGQESEDFAIDFYTDGLKHIEVSRLSGIYKHCAVTDSEKPAIVTITLVNHGFGIGTLKYDLKTWAPNTATSDGDIATNVPVIEGSYELVLGAGDDQSEAEIQAAIDCIKAALEAQSAANEAIAAMAKALTAASGAETAEAAIDTTLDNVVKSVDNNTTAVDSLKAVQETIKTALDMYLPSVEWSRSVEAANGNSYGAVKFGSAASLFTKIPNLVFSDKDTMTDFSSMFMGCKNLQSVTTDELVAMFPMITSISGNCGYMFNGCTGLTSVSFSQDFSGYCGNMFQGCTGLTSVSFSQDFSGNCGYMFLGCTGLTSVSFSHDFSGYCGYMFNGCTGLTSVSFSHDLSGYCGNMFGGCTGLTSVTVTATMTQFPSLQWSTKLDKASAESIINHLADLTGKTKQILTLSKTAITTDYGSTTADEWTTLVASATAKNWTVSLN